MKEKLLCLLALAAMFSIPVAQAQSNVTVYGILDVGYAGGTSTVNNSSTGTTETNSSAIASSPQQSSRLGFRGNEDLGGGRQAVFTTEFGLSPTDQSLSGNANAGVFNRQTFVGIKQNGVGQATAGLQYTPVFTAYSLTNAGMTNNMVGDIIHPFATAISAPLSGTTQSGMTDRVSNSFVLQSESFNGFRTMGMLTANGKTVNGNDTTANGWGLGADYTWNKLYVTLATQQLKQLTTATNGSAAASVMWTMPQANGVTAAPVSGNGTTLASQGVNVQDNQTYAGATYDFGILKAYAGYITRKATSTADSADSIRRRATQIGIRGFITPTIEGWASAGVGHYKAGDSIANSTAGIPTANFSAFQLGSNYWLSKRTNLYAIYGQTKTDNGSASVGGATTSGSANNYAVGMRHTF